MITRKTEKRRLVSSPAHFKKPHNTIPLLPNHLRNSVNPNLNETGRPTKNDTN